jgi:hypothetical protein
MKHPKKINVSLTKEEQDYIEQVRSTFKQKRSKDQTIAALVNWCMCNNAHLELTNENFNFASTQDASELE